MQPLGLHHVSINVDDLDAAIAFYVGRLGGSVRTDRPDLGVDGAWIDLGVGQLHLIVLPPPADLGQHFALQVRDLDAVVAELRDAGCEVSDPSPIASGLQAFTEDPSGNRVELHRAAAS